MTEAPDRLGRDLWSRLEAVHSVAYFTPEASYAGLDLGLRGFWRNYFAMRLAPLGPVDAALGTAVAYGFAPAMVARALPSVWAIAPPEAVLPARLAGAVAALRTHALGGAGDPSDEELAAAAQALRRVVAACEPAGRPIGAPNAALPWPDDPLAALWHAATVLREHRGDGHVAVLAAEGIDGCQSHALRIAAGDLTRERIAPIRGWSDADWEAAFAGLTDRGLVAAGALTEAGAALRVHVEARTDALAAGPYAALSATGFAAVVTAVGPLAARLAGGAVPYPNPIGAPSPPAAGGS